MYIFLDTNIFLHFVDFDQIDWKKVASSTDDVVLVIAPVVLEEVDSHKYNKNNRLAQKAKKLLPKLERAFESVTSNKCKVMNLIERPKEAVFLDHHLDRLVKDDHLLASIIQFKQGLSETDKVVFITHDLGPRLKAKSLGIAALPMNEQYLLPNEPDELEVKNRELQKEINELRNKIPKLSLTFLDQSLFKTYHRNKLQETKEAFMERALTRVRVDYQPLNFQDVNKHISNNPLAGLYSHPLFTVPKSEIEDYNRNLESFFEDYEEYAAAQFEELVFKNNTIKIEFRLENTGTVPAQDIDIDIHFPDGFDLLMESDFPQRMSMPEPPEMPKRGFPALQIPPSFLYPSNMNFNPNDTIVRLDLPRIKRTNSYNVSYHFDGLKHNQSIALEPLYAVFDDISKARGFQIDYTLIVSNVPNPVAGTLNINFAD
jgi:hypothetical protein